VNRREYFCFVSGAFVRGGAITSAGLWGNNRHSKRVDRRTALDPYQSSQVSKWCDTTLNCATPA